MARVCKRSEPSNLRSHTRRSDCSCGPFSKTRTTFIVKSIAVYDDFCHANDPYEENDFGSFEVDGQTIFFKIDYLDKALASHSCDPADPSVTERVITIMLAEEY